MARKCHYRVVHRKAVYPGSFDPLTLGHVDIIERAAKLFDELVVGVGINSEKSPYFSGEERVAALVESTNHIPNVRIEQFGGLLYEFARKQNCECIVRGLRAISDFDYEFRVSLANRKMAPELETIFLVTREEYSFLASSVVREVAALGGPYEMFVPAPVAEMIRAKLARSSG